MTTILIQLRETGVTPRNLRKAVGDAMRVAFASGMRHWHTAIRDKHFTKAGAREYGYQPRQGERGARGSRSFQRSYTGRKLRRYGHTRPLEYTGETRLLTDIARIRGTRTSAKVVYPQARGLNRRASPSAPNMREEFTRWSLTDRDAATAVVNQTAAREIGKVRGEHVERIT